MYPLTEFLTEEEIDNISSPYYQTITYSYEGICPQTGEKLTLPRTIVAEKIAIRLSKQLTQRGWEAKKGKMLGVLIIKDKTGKLGVIKAFSGSMKEEKQLTGWVTQIPGHSVIALAEKLTLQKLEQIKEQILELQHLPIRQVYPQLQAEFTQEKKQLKQIHRQRKKARDKQRQTLLENEDTQSLETQMYQLQQQSRRDDWERRKLKQRWQEKLEPIEKQINEADKQIQQLKQGRKQASRQLQAQMQTAYTITNFAGDSLSVGKLMGKTFIPTGTGDCCLPKLLHHCATHNLLPVAMAEIWWGKTSPNGLMVAGNFYPACEERCQPLMGFLLSGLQVKNKIDRSLSMPIIYQDDYLIAVDKSSGLLSVSGRGSDKFDSVVSRFRQITGNENHLYINAVHRLDQDTSGLLLLAKDDRTYIHLSQQFAQGKVKKIYEAIVCGIVTNDDGEINLPLWGNPLSRPRQEVNYQYGKPSLTYYRVLEKDTQNKTTRIEFIPHTGRTHQLRVHSLFGLGFAIKGDKLYDKAVDGDDRLFLHARDITFTHPITQQTIHLKTKIPF